MQVTIPYQPHLKQLVVHQDKHRFKVIAAGRRSGKTTLAINELIKVALTNPNGRTWYIAPTYKQAKSIAWDDLERGIFKYLPDELIAPKGKRVSELSIRLVNGHLMEFKGAENRAKLRGAALNAVVLDEYGQMAGDVWDAVIRPMLTDTHGTALFIGTPDPTKGPHFEKLWKDGQQTSSEWKSWTFFTKDNLKIPGIEAEVQSARDSLPPDIFRQEYEADFSVGQGLIYDNFDMGIHVIPGYEPLGSDLIIGSIDPGLVNETAAILTAWDPSGTCRVFKEYYQKEFLADQNAREILAWSKPYRVSYWIIDRACIRREPNGGPTVYDIYRGHLGVVHTAKNDPGSVNYGINEVKKLLQPNAATKQCKLYVSGELTNFLYEITHYAKYKPKTDQLQNPPDKPRKYKDHLMDCLKNVVMSRPWLLRDAGFKYRGTKQNNYTGY